MGVKFSKELTLAREQIVPSVKEDKDDLTPVQQKLMRKFGATAYPFTFNFPVNSPSSVTLQPGDDDSGKPLGVEYSIKTFVADSPEERGHKRSSVTLAIKKVCNTNRGPDKTNFLLVRCFILIFCRYVFNISENVIQLTFQFRRTIKMNFRRALHYL